MTTQRTNLPELREQAMQDLEYHQVGGLDTSYPLGVLALIDAVEAAQTLIDAADYGGTTRRWNELRETLDRFDHQNQP